MLTAFMKITIFLKFYTYVDCINLLSVVFFVRLRKIAPLLYVKGSNLKMRQLCMLIIANFHCVKFFFFSPSMNLQFKMKNYVKSGVQQNYAYFLL